jgi:hypothetical protein
MLETFARPTSPSIIDVIDSSLQEQSSKIGMARIGSQAIDKR